MYNEYPMMYLNVSLDGIDYCGSQFEAEPSLVREAQTLIKDTATAVSDGSLNNFSVDRGSEITVFNKHQMERAILSVKHGMTDIY